MHATSIVNDSKLREFFIEQLQDIYWAEQELVDTLPKMATAAISPKLKKAFNDHLEQAREHVTRLEQVFGLIDEEADNTECEAMASINNEGKDNIDDTEEGAAQRDVDLIFAGQKAEHYENATYSELASLAKILSYNDAAGISCTALEEEKEIDNSLTDLAGNDADNQASHKRAED